MRQSNVIFILLMCVLVLTGCKQGTGTSSETDSKDNETLIQDDADKGNPEDGQSKKSSNEETAKKYVEILAEEDYTKLAEEFSYDSELQKAVDSGQIEASLKPNMAALGELKSIEKVSSVTQGGYEGINVSCIFENEKIDVVISFNDKNEITGIFFNEYTGDQAQEEFNTLPENIYEEELALTCRDGAELPGTLTLPEGEGPFPVAVFVHGSGSNDRDETVGTIKPFRDIAWSLAEAGIASYRYDKRTYVYGAELAKQYDMTLYEETVFDAADAVSMLQRHDQIQSDQAFVIGHSLGGYAIPLISLEADPAGYIGLAATPRSLVILVKEQLNFLQDLEMNQGAEQQQSIQEMLQEAAKLDDLESLNDNEAVMGAYPAYWKQIMEYDPLDIAKTIDKPVLILQGEEDYQVTMVDYEMWKDQFKNSSNWEFISYPGLTHLFTKGNKEDGPNAYAVDGSVDEKVISDMIHFILK